MPAPPLIEIRHASLYRGQNQVFADLNLTIRQSEQVAILGPNGAGKTTLIKALNREIYPRADQRTTFRILGRDTWNVWALRRQLGFVSAELQHRYRETTTVRDVVLSGFLSSIGVHGLAGSELSPAQESIADATLAELELGPVATRQFGSLSTGQQRLALLARALVHEPQTLILDEPAAGLDFGVAFEVMRRIRDLAHKGVGVVIVTHHLDEIPPETRRIVLLGQGEILEDGAPEDVLTDALLSEAYGVALRVRRIDGRYFAVPVD